MVSLSVTSGKSDSFFAWKIKFKFEFIYLYRIKREPFLYPASNSHMGNQEGHLPCSKYSWPYPHPAHKEFVSLAHRDNPMRYLKRYITEAAPKAP